MFIVAVTKGDRRIRWPGMDFNVFRQGTWSIAVGASSVGARLVQEDGGFRLVESPLAGVSRQTEVPVAVAEFDAACQELRITKPLFSGRPIYFHQNAAREFFCTTHVALLRPFGVSIQPDDAAVAEYLIYRYVVPPATLYQSVSQLPLGARLRVGVAPEGCAMGKMESWSAPEPGSSARSEELAAEIVGRLMARLQRLESVQSQLAVLLSGGLDSTTLFRVAQRLFGVKESYSTGFPFAQDGGRNVELEYAETAASALGANHHYYESSAQDYLRGVLSAIAAAEEPVHHLQSVLLWLLFKRGLPADKPVVISGQGADGVFGLELQHRFWRREHPTALLAAASRVSFAPVIQWLIKATG